MLISVELGMVGSTAASSSACCDARHEKIPIHVRALAVIMVAGMATVLGNRSRLTYIGAALVAGLSLSLLSRQASRTDSCPRTRRFVDRCLARPSRPPHEHARVTNAYGRGRLDDWDHRVKSRALRRCLHGFGTHFLIPSLVLAFMAFVVWSAKHAREWVSAAGNFNAGPRRGDRNIRAPRRHGGKPSSFRNQVARLRVKGVSRTQDDPRQHPSRCTAVAQYGRVTSYRQMPRCLPRPTELSHPSLKREASSISLSLGRKRYLS